MMACSGWLLSALIGFVVLGLPGDLWASDAAPIDSGATAWIADLNCLGAVDGAGSGDVLRGPGAYEERAWHDDAQLCGDGNHERAVGDMRL